MTPLPYPLVLGAGRSASHPGGVTGWGCAKLAGAAQVIGRANLTHYQVDADNRVTVTSDADCKWDSVPRAAWLDRAGRGKRIAAETLMPAARGSHSRRRR